MMDESGRDQALRGRERSRSRDGGQLAQGGRDPARSDANPAMNVFGGLPFEPGHKVFVPASMAHKAREILSHYPHFHDLRNVHEPGH